MMNRRIYEGAFASNNPRACVLAGVGQLRAAEPDGLAVARFAWADKATGRASNERTSPAQQLGFVQPVIGQQTRVYVERRQVFIRPGLECTLFSRGDFYARFAYGALAGQPVYASLLDGAVISGQSDDAELTPWTVATNCAPGELAIITTWSPRL